MCVRVFLSPLLALFLSVKRKHFPSIDYGSLSATKMLYVEGTGGGESFNKLLFEKATTKAMSMPVDAAELGVGAVGQIRQLKKL